MYVGNQDKQTKGRYVKKKPLGTNCQADTVDTSQSWISIASVLTLINVQKLHHCTGDADQIGQYQQPISFAQNWSNGINHVQVALDYYQ